MRQYGNQQGVTAIDTFRIAAFRIQALSKIEQIELMRCNTQIVWFIFLKNMINWLIRRNYMIDITCNINSSISITGLNSDMLKKLILNTSDGSHHFVSKD
jgi:hypothetical protein